MLTEDDLYPYQADGVAWLRQGGRRLLGDDPGLGKTPQALIAAKGPCLVVARSTLHGQWAEEAERWRPDLELTIATYQGTALRDGRRIVKGRIRADLDREWGTIIFDEATALKGRKANVAKVAEKLVERTENAYLLSGTPIPNWAHEWFQLLRIMRPEGVDVGSYWRWVGHWFDQHEVTFQRGKRPTKIIGGLQSRWTWDDFITQNSLDKVYLGRRKEDHLPGLPPLTVTPMAIEMPPAQRKLYESLKKDYVAWVEETGEEVSAWSSGGLHTKLRKAATGVPVVAPDSPGPAAKVQAAIDLAVDQLPVVMFCHYRRSVEFTAAEAERQGLKARSIMGGMKADEIDEVRQAFQSGEVDVLVGTFEMMSEGLTLHRANLGIMIEKSFRPDLNQQAMDRLHRIGQGRPVTIVDLYSAGTVDEGQRKLLDEKLAETGALMGELRLSAGKFLALI